MNSELKRLTDKIQHKRAELRTLLNEYKDIGMDGYTYREGVPIDEVRRRMDEINELNVQIEQQRLLTTATQSCEQEQMIAKTVPHQKGLIESLMERYPRDYMNKSVEIGDYNMLHILKKTLFQTSDGWDPVNVPIPGISAYPVYVPTLLDRVRIVQTSMSAVPFYQENSWTNAAVPKAEGAAAAEAEFELTLKTVPVERIPVWIPATQEQLEDVPEARAYLESRLALSVRQALENQILNGDGSPPNLSGILATTGLNTQAVGTDTAMDAIGLAIAKCEGSGATPGFAVADLIIMHPTDWTNVQLTKDVNGNYLLGNPGQMIEPRLWGLPVQKSNLLPIGTALVGSFANYHAVYMRRGVTVNATDSHEGNFVKDIVAIKAVLRAANVVLRPQAFCEVTGL